MVGNADLRDGGFAALHELGEDGDGAGVPPAYDQLRQVPAGSRPVAWRWSVAPHHSGTAVGRTSGVARYSLTLARGLVAVPTCCQAGHGHPVGEAIAGDLGAIDAQNGGLGGAGVLPGGGGLDLRLVVHLVGDLDGARQAPVPEAEELIEDDRPGAWGR